jgi:hypothetical protein
MPEFDRTTRGCRLTTPVGGVLTGRGADLIIIGDPLKPEEALSQAQRQAANDWYDHTLYTGCVKNPHLPPPHLFRHSRAGGNPGFFSRLPSVPAFAGTTISCWSRNGHTRVRPRA